MFGHDFTISLPAWKNGGEKQRRSYHDFIYFCLPQVSLYGSLFRKHSLVVVPGGTDTNMTSKVAGAARTSHLLQKPNVVASKSLAVLGKKNKIVVAPFKEKIFLYFCGLFPELAGKLIALLLERS